MKDSEISFIRSQFPALHNASCVYLDNAGGSQVAQVVADRIHQYLLSTSVQLGASYRTSVQAQDRVLAARRAIADLVNAKDDREIVMGGSTTGLMFLLIQALRPSIRPGDEIILTNTDHEANIGAWKRLEEVGAVIKIWEVNRQTMLLELEQLEPLLSPRTKWLAMTHASNILGTINPVAEVAQRVHAVGGRVCVDGVAYAPHRLVDVQASGADIYVFSFYKVFGPHYALMWGHLELLNSLANLNHFFIPADELPYKLQPGNVNFELSYGCAGIRDYLLAVADFFQYDGTPRQRMQAVFKKFEDHENALAEQLLSYLRSKEKVSIIGLNTVTQGKQILTDGNMANDSNLTNLIQRVPTISFVHQELASPEIVRHIDQYGIGIRYGDFYAKHLISTLDLEKHGGVVRVSIAHYNTEQEIARLIRHLDEVL
ncbi:cysteine desulfurase-like protein [Undibacterium cyanobacteriorum]|uniref:Cysteine desulfurase-like protein n=1 Tax=Undibacterium cyanobacteriorum TaxID=3073561 RepID=A0ABY9RLJ8_9BURK|nr:cysteine desulfurase-like protein [Undibacterium sp. 20NA77.5]WMW82087.1 cysteine desulfurase-like protein [Undibacterium sp. 20NA77.5]